MQADVICSKVQLFMNKALCIYTEGPVRQQYYIYIDAHTPIIPIYKGRTYVRSCCLCIAYACCCKLRRI